MKRIISIVLVFMICTTISSYAEMTDVSMHWASKEIYEFINNDYIHGYDNNTFLPNNNIKVNEFLKIIALTIDSRIVKSKEEWPKPYIDFCIENNIIKEVTYNYEELLTREDAINIIYEYLKFYEIEDTNISDEKLKFVDESNPSEKLKLLYYAHIVNGYEDGTIRLTSNITRAEVVTVISRLIKYRDNTIYSKSFNIYDCDEEKRAIYTNYLGNDEITFYEINNNQVIYTDLGKYSYYEKIRSNVSETILNLINILSNKENYVFTTYIPENQCTYIAFGENKEYISNGYILWDIYLYDNSHIKQEVEYKTRISVYKLWKYLDEVKNNKINSHYVRKLEDTLYLFMEQETAKEIILHIEKGGGNKKIGNVYIQKESNNFLIYI